MGFVYITNGTSETYGKLIITTSFDQTYWVWFQFVIRWKGMLRLKQVQDWQSLKGAQLGRLCSWVYKAATWWSPSPLKFYWFLDLAWPNFSKCAIDLKVPSLLCASPKSVMYLHGKNVFIFGLYTLWVGWKASQICLQSSPQSGPK